MMPSSILVSFIEQITEQRFRLFFVFISIIEQKAKQTSKMSHHVQELSKARDEYKKLLRKYRIHPMLIKWPVAEIVRRVKILRAECEKIKDICEQIVLGNSDERIPMRAVMLKETEKIMAFERWVYEQQAQHRARLAKGGRPPHDSESEDDELDRYEVVDGFEYVPPRQQKIEGTLESNGEDASAAPAQEQESWDDEDGAIGGVPAKRDESPTKRKRVQSAVVVPRAEVSEPPRRLVVLPMAHRVQHREGASEHRCFVCESNGHWPHRCPGMQIICRQARTAIMRSRGACLNCFRLGHKEDECLAEPCFRCPGIRHNSLLCPKSPANRRN